MKTIFLFLVSLLFIQPAILKSKEPLNSIFPVRGFCIAALHHDWPGDYICFIRTELAPGKVNTFRRQSAPEMRNQFRGMMQTVWSDPGSFMHEFYVKKKTEEIVNTPSNFFRALYSEIVKHNSPAN